MFNITLTNYNENFLEKSWVWLNDPEIKYLTNTSDFSKEQQANWYKNLQEKTDYKIWGVLANKFPIGVFGIKNISKGTGEYWGYIGEKDYWGKGLGKEIMKLIIIEAKILNLVELYLFVIPENIRAIKLYESMGFNEEREKDEKILMKLIL